MLLKMEPSDFCMLDMHFIPALPTPLASECSFPAAWSPDPAVTPPSAAYPSQTAPPPTLPQAQHLSASPTSPPALPRSHPYKNCNSGRWEKAPSWISEKAAFTRVLQGTHESSLCECLKGLYWAQRWTGQWYLYSAALLSSPPVSVLCFPNSGPLSPLFPPAASGSTRGPRLTFPSQARAGSITSTIAIIQHPQCVAAAEGWGSQMWDLAASLVPQARGGGHGPVAAREAGPAVCRTADPVAGGWPVPRYQSPLPLLLSALLLSVLPVTSQGGASMLM